MSKISIIDIEKVCNMKGKRTCDDQDIKIDELSLKEVEHGFEVEDYEDDTIIYKPIRRKGEKHKHNIKNIYTEDDQY